MTDSQYVLHRVIGSRTTHGWLDYCRCVFLSGSTRFLGDKPEIPNSGSNSAIGSLELPTIIPARLQTDSTHGDSSSTHRSAGLTGGTSVIYTTSVIDAESSLMELDDSQDISRSTSSPGTGPRRRWLVLLGIGLAVAIAVVTIGELSRPAEPVYHAEALVVANELAIRVESLPRTAVAIFNSSGVAELAVSLSGTDVDPDYLFRKIVSAEPVENTNVIKVDSVHTDPELAAAYANAAGEALAQELNRIGAGLGSFSLHMRAEVPDAPIPTGRLQLVVAALTAGIAGAMGAAGLYSLWSGAGSKQDQQHHPTVSHPPVNGDPTEKDDPVVPVTLIEGEEEIGGSAEHPTPAARQQQLGDAMENPDDRHNRWRAALEDVQSLKDTQPSEVSQSPSGTSEQDGSSAADNENASDNAASTRGEGRHPRTTRRVSGEAPIHQVRRPSSLISGPDREDPPANGPSG